MRMKNFYNLINFLKFKKRQGWLDRRLEADSIASHIYGAANIGWLLAKKEKADQNRVVMMLLAHDLIMANIPDVTPRSGSYGQKKDLEREATPVMIANLPPEIKEEFAELMAEFEEQKTKEAVIAHEADKLETLMQGASYEQQTDRDDILDEFLETYRSVFKTVSGKQLYQEIKKAHETKK